MEARFILPATLAAVFHTFVLFGVTWTHPPKVVPGTITISVRPPLKDDDAELPVPKDDTTEETVKGAKGTPTDVADLPEPPVSGGHPEFLMPIPDNPTHNNMQGNTLPVGPVGTPDGNDIGKIASHTFTDKMLDNHPRATAQVPPIYPSDLKRQGIEGSVLVEFIVDETGHVIDPHVLRSSDPGFDGPTLRAVANWRFEPGRRENRVVRFRMALPVAFKLDR